MKQIICESCGASDFVEKAGFRICQYCGTQYQINSKSNISLEDDIQRLLRKCKEEPKKARRYANLILDIDPTNEEALKYLR